MTEPIHVRVDCPDHGTIEVEVADLMLAVALGVVFVACPGGHLFEQEVSKPRTLSVLVGCGVSTVDWLLPD